VTVVNPVSSKIIINKNDNFILQVFKDSEILSLKINKLLKPDLFLL
jgi:hypothetical protein